MCTVTWWRGEEGALSIFFNRDERRSRPASSLVDYGKTAGGMEYLAPRDPEAGGTWLLANAHGLVAGVLNHYEAESDSAQPRCSRGQLPLRMADCRSTGEVASIMRTIECGDFAPFILVCWGRDGESSWVWNGASLEQTPPQQPLTTSSYRTPEVLAWRRELYARLVAGGGPDELAPYHDDTSNADTAFNVRMSRSDARTESLCRVDVSPERVRFLHRRLSIIRDARPDVRELIVERR